MEGKNKKRHTFVSMRACAAAPCCQRSRFNEKSLTDHLTQTGEEEEGGGRCVWRKVDEGVASAGKHTARSAYEVTRRRRRRSGPGVSRCTGRHGDTI